MTTRSKPGPPMTLANMRQNSVRAVTATCEACKREADINVDALPESVHVPEAGKRLRCSSCGGKQINTRPAWHTGAHRPGTPAIHHSTGGKVADLKQDFDGFELSDMPDDVDFGWLFYH
jgi:hypothetical protein